MRLVEPARGENRAKAGKRGEEGDDQAKHRLGPWSSTGMMAPKCFPIMSTPMTVSA